MCQEPLNSIQINSNGSKLVAGDARGTVYILELSEKISVIRKNEKALVNSIFEREQRKSKFSETAIKETKIKSKATKKIIEKIDKNLEDVSIIKNEVKDELADTDKYID